MIGINKNIKPRGAYYHYIIIYYYMFIGQVGVIGNSCCNKCNY